VTEPSGFTARPRAGHQIPDLGRLLAECERLRSRFARAARDGREAFVAEDSDSYDIGMLAVIQLADFVSRELPEDVQDALPKAARDGLRATRNIAAHNYAGLDNSRLWSTVSVRAPELIDTIEEGLRKLSAAAGAD